MRLIRPLIAIALVLAACGGDDAAPATTTGATSTVVGSSTTTSPTSTPAGHREYNHPYLSDDEIATLRTLCVDGNKDACEELWTAIGETINADASSYGDDPNLDILYDVCAEEGNAAACKNLAAAAPEGSGYLDVEFAGLDDGLGTTFEPAVSAGGLGDDPTLDALWQDCSVGDWQSCDLLYLQAPAGSAYEHYGASCGGVGFYAFGCDHQFSGSVLAGQVLVPDDEPVTFGGDPAIITSFAGPPLVTPPATITVTWTTLNAECGVALNGAQVAENGSMDFAIPAGTTGTLTYTLVARDVTCDVGTQAGAQLLIPVQAATTTTTIDFGPTIIASGTFEVSSIDAVDLDTGTRDYLFGGSIAPDSIDIQWENGCSDTQMMEHSRTSHDALPCYTLESIGAAMFDYPAGAGFYDDCSTTLPPEIVVLNLPRVKGFAIPEAADGLVTRICYRTQQSHLGVMTVSRVPRGAICWGGDCATLWNLAVTFTTWDA